ncbi:MAG: site-specific integrase [Clostridiales bacterium]|nr:site-specific integrase [Clostridiales bacterium]
MACIKKNKLENGMVSYRIQVKAKNERTGKFQTKVMTWRKPPELNEKSVQRELNKIAIEFEEKFRKQLNGMLAIDESITFMEYAQKWLEQIKTTRSINYYIKGRDALKKFEAYFGNVKLNAITPVMVQGFIDDLCAYQVETKRAFLIADIQQYVKSHCIELKELFKKAELSRSIYFSATSGHGILVDNAEKICKALGVDFKKYFTIKIDRHPYAKETVMKFKRTLATILASAKRQRLVEHNFASRDYITPIQGYKKEIEILNDKEAIELERYLRDKEENPRWRIAMQIVLYMGLRRGEVAGLEWKDIDFENKTMKIARSVQEVNGFGIITKEPKTETSKRVIYIPERLISYLLEYKTFWDNRKKYLGDRWSKTDRLFCTDDGDDISPGLFIVWLHKILDRAGLPRVTLHSLRHTNITLQLANGVDMKTVSVRAGHSKASTTSDFYSHFLKTPDQHASATIDKIFE